MLFVWDLSIVWGFVLETMHPREPAELLALLFRPAICKKTGLFKWYILEKIIIYMSLNFLFHGGTAPTGPGPSYCRSFSITLRHTTLGRTPLDEWSARRRHKNLTTHDIHNRQTSMPQVGFEPPSLANERAQAHALDCAVTGIDCHFH